VPLASVYLSPGFFGFARIASLSYFEHLERAIQARLCDRGFETEIHICDVHPTASIRRRAARLAQMIHATSAAADSVHIVGHSTGGLDARLVASPSVHLPDISAEGMRWIDKLRSVTTINAPHYGTPLAAFFATVSGQRLLYAVSALTFTALKLGAPPLAAASALVAAFGRIRFGAFEVELVERTTEAVVKVLDDASSRDLRAFLRLLREDQGAVVQLMPEAMDLFQAGVEDRVGLRYQSVASYSPQTGVTDWVSALGAPWSVVSAGIFSMLYNITARQDPRYPCASHDESGPRRLRAMLGEVPPVTANDGVVPLYSQIWGDLIWVGKADHLDIVGHFPGSRGRRGRGRADLPHGEPPHNDWLASGSGFNRVRFDTIIDRVVDGMMVGEETPHR
jgi:triacylglycerol lipase